jgi:hypothetical protein
MKANLGARICVLTLFFATFCQAQPSCPPGAGSAATNLGGMDCTGRCDLCMTITPNNIELHRGDTVSFRFTSRLATHGDMVIQGGGAVDWGEGDAPEPISAGTVTVSHAFNKCPGTCVYTVWGSMAQDYKYDGAGSCSYKCLARQSATVRVIPIAVAQQQPVQRDPETDKKEAQEQKPTSDDPSTAFGSLLRSQPLDKLLAFCFGVVFVVLILIVAVFDRDPPPFSLFIYRVVLSLAAAGVGAVIPGIVNVDINPVVRAGGALALFVVVFWFNPPSIIAQAKK